MRNIAHDFLHASIENTGFFPAPFAAKPPFRPEIARKVSNPLKSPTSNTLILRDLFWAGIKPAETRHLPPSRVPRDSPGVFAAK
ncbi:hypothetical protein [Ruegeria sp. PrR005]|uniref:Uncharacterized protein n=1 Tax=Ruegeria sp. PrR005 TaxID=2706882 RepID=A0A6B2NM16_9RHOB|nr:hypothetical protein [Ruegeria sp. PrR005]NDW44388.1 hypothetical protein [Ruegeria sp. PrR005]